ncbi:MAG: Uma2 family endonuclease [Pirellulales bacterium]
MSLDLTTSAIESGDDAVRPPVPPLYRFSVEEYHRMPAAGILAGEERVELLDGWIVPMTPIGPLHCRAIEKLRRMIEQFLPAGWHVRCQHPITLATSEPQPDLAVVRGGVDDFGERHPSPSDLALLIEVSDSSLHIDQVQKLPLYAAAGVPEYWIVDLDQSRLEVHRDPRPGSHKAPASYALRQQFQRQDAVPLVLAGSEAGRLDLRDLLR